MALLFTSLGEDFCDYFRFPGLQSVYSLGKDFTLRGYFFPFELISIAKEDKLNWQSCSP